MRLGGRTTILALCLLTATLAGCIGGEGEDPPTQVGKENDEALDPSTSSDELADDVDTDAVGPGMQPAWTHGDWWTYDITYDPGFGTILDGPTTLVLHDVQGGYSVAAADRNAAIVDQHFDLFAVGELGTELNPTGDSGFQMFDFPLEDGKSWTTEVGTLNGTSEIVLTAERVTNADDPDGPTEGFEISGETDDGLSLSYTYSPLAGWITSFELLAPNFDGEIQPILTLTLTDHGSAFEGTFVVLDMEILYFRDAIAAPLPGDGTIPPVDTITVPEDATFVQRVVAMFGFDLGPPTSGVAQVDVLSPEDEHETYRYTPGSDVLAFTIDEPPIPGEWTVSYQGAGTTVMIVGFFSFTEEIVEFTAESHAHHQ